MSLAKEWFEEKYLGKRVRVTINDPHDPYCAREGVVKYVDDLGQLHGTWGSLAAIPYEDLIEIVDEGDNSNNPKGGEK